MWLNFTKEQAVLAAAAVASIGALYAPELLLRAGSIRNPFKRRGPGVQIADAFFSDEARRRHTHIVGATGSGKTVFIEQLCEADINRGYGMIILDAKGDRSLYEKIRHLCKVAGREHDLHYLSSTYLKDSNVWNPCGLGNVSELQSKFYNSSIYSEPHYAKWCEHGLLEVFTRLTTTEPKGFNLSHVCSALKEVATELKSSGENLEGLRLDLQNLVDTEWRSVLAVGKSATIKKEISLLDIVRNNQILFVDLPTEARKIQSARVGRLLTQELMLISGIFKIHPELMNPKPFSVFIDEFDAFATETFVTFMNKSQSAGFMIHLIHQTLSDLKRISPEFAGQIQGNCNIRVIFRQDEPDDAETWSRFLGTKSILKRTFQTNQGSRTGSASNREVQEFIIHPDQIKTLKTGQAVLSIKTDSVTRLIKPKLQAFQTMKFSYESAVAIESRDIGGEVASQSLPVSTTKSIDEVLPLMQGENLNPQQPRSGWQISEALSAPTQIEKEDL